MTRTTADKTIPAAIRVTRDRLVAADQKIFDIGISSEAVRGFDRLLDQVDREAGSGLAVGRVVAIPHADGHAHYLVARIGVRTCRLVHLPVGDAWESPRVARNGSCPTPVVRQNLRYQFPE